MGDAAEDDRLRAAQRCVEKSVVDEGGFCGAETDVSSDLDDTSVCEESATPPLLKYRRLTGMPSRFFSKDPVSYCFCAGDFTFLATHSGIIHLTDKYFRAIRTFKAHNSSVLSIESDGEHFISGSIDGTVVVGSISNNDVIKYDFKRPIQAVAFDRTYSKTNGFFCGGTSGQLLYCTKNWLGQRSDFTVDENHGIITMIKTVDDIVMWCNDSGINVAQITSKQQLLNIPVPKGIQQPGLYWPRIHRIDEDRMLLAWVNNLWVFRVVLGQKQPMKALSHAAASFKSNYDEKQIEIEHHAVLDDTMVGGISDFKDNLMILNYFPGYGNSMLPPEIKILDRDTLDELSVDEIEVKNYKSLSINDYHLQCTGNNSWILVTSYDAIIIEEFSLQDQLDFFLQRELFMDAWNLAGLWLDKYEKLAIGMRQVNLLLQAGKLEESAQFISKVLHVPIDETDETFVDKCVQEWNAYLHKMEEIGSLHLAAKCLPPAKFLGGLQQVDQKYYDLILSHFLHENEISQFLEYLGAWDHTLFDLAGIKVQLLDYLSIWDNDHNSSSEDVERLRNAYIQVCLLLDEPGDCIPQKVKLGDVDLLEFLDKYHLILEFIHLLPEIIMISIPSNCIKDENMPELRKNKHLQTNLEILVENSHEILPTKIIKVLKNAKLDIINYMYLEQLSKVDILLTKDFEDDMIDLYARFDKTQLYDFISKHKNYSIDKAVGICEQYHCNQELVYLFSKVGQNEKALTIIIDDLNDPAMAINFVSKINDQKVWDFLLDYSMSKSDFIKALLLSAGDWIDPVPVVSRIPKGVEILDLKSVLLKIMANGQLDEYLYSLIERIIASEGAQTESEYMDVRTKGILIENDDLKRVKLEPSHGFIKYTFKKDGIYLDEELIGTRFKTQGNKITHKSFVKAKLGKN